MSLMQRLLTPTLACGIVLLEWEVATQREFLDGNEELKPPGPTAEVHQLESARRGIVTEHMKWPWLPLRMRGGSTRRRPVGHPGTRQATHRQGFRGFRCRAKRRRNTSIGNNTTRAHNCRPKTKRAMHDTLEVRCSSIVVWLPELLISRQTRSHLAALQRAAGRGASVTEVAQALVRLRFSASGVRQTAAVHAESGLPSKVSGLVEVGAAVESHSSGSSEPRRSTR